MIAERFILRCGRTAQALGLPEPAVASVVGTAFAIATKHLLPMGHRPGANDNG